MGNGCRELAHCGEASNPGELLSCFLKLLLADLHNSLRHFEVFNTGARAHKSDDFSPRISQRNGLFEMPIIGSVGMHKRDFERPSGARSYPSPEYCGCAFAMVRVQAREKRREIVRSASSTARSGPCNGRPSSPSSRGNNEIACAIRCNRPCDC